MKICMHFSLRHDVIRLSRLLILSHHYIMLNPDNCILNDMTFSFTPLKWHDTLLDCLDPNGISSYVTLWDPKWGDMYRRKAGEQGHRDEAITIPAAEPEPTYCRWTWPRVHQGNDSVIPYAKPCTESVSICRLDRICRSYCSGFGHPCDLCSYSFIHELIHWYFYGRGWPVAKVKCENISCTWIESLGRWQIECRAFFITFVPQWRLPVINLYSQVEIRADFKSLSEYFWPQRCSNNDVIAPWLCLIICFLSFVFHKKRNTIYSPFLEFAEKEHNIFLVRFYLP